MRAAGALAAVLGVQLAVASVVHEKAPARASGWEVVGTENDSKLEFTFAVTHTSEAKAWLLKTVEEVSNPKHARYGEYYTRDELKARIAPPVESITAITQSLTAAGFDVAVEDSGDFITASAAASVAANYFEVKFCRWEHKASSRFTVRACSSEYSLPSHISPLVDMVSGLLHFPSQSQLKVSSSKPSAAGTNYVDQLRKTYNTTSVRPSKVGKNATACFTQFLGQWYNPRDLQAFERKYIPEQEGQVIAKKVGEWKAGDGMEAELDAQYLVAMGAGVETWVWSNQKKNTVNNQEPWVEFLSNVASASEVPNLFSVSYGDAVNTLTKQYMDRSDVEFQKVASRGITMLLASGDNGAGCNKMGTFEPNFPAQLPHITSVGATANCLEGSHCAVFSSGGFSDFYPRPQWQAAAVSKYLTGSLPPARMFNSSGRAYPDVAACGFVDICVAGVCGLGVSGTSVAAPVFSGVMSLINDARLSAGKPALGFLSPALYEAWAANPKVFNDVTQGRTEGCATVGWEAREGWDPTTGLGTPAYYSLASALLK